MEKNRTDALNACEEAHNFGYLTGAKIVPLTPHVNFPYLDCNSPEEKAETLKMGLFLLSKSNEMWVAGDIISEEMRSEIRLAARMQIPVMSMGIESSRIQDLAADLAPMLSEKNCFKNSNHKDYANQLLILKESTLAPWAKEPENQLWIAENGFGVKLDARGRAVYATCLYDGEKARWNRDDFIGIANPNRLPDWAKEKLSEMRHEEEEEMQL
jgi:hypothetical protein